MEGFLNMQALMVRGRSRLSGLAWLASTLALILSATISQAQTRTSHRGFSLDRNITAEEITALRATGANIAYYFLNPGEQGRATDLETYLSYLDIELARLDEVIAQFKAVGVKVGINLYGSPGEFVDSQNPAWHKVFAEEWAQRALVEAWKRIAARYKGESTVWVYNLLNEPAERSVAPGLKNWKALSSEIVDTIRAIDPGVRIMIQAPYGNPNKLRNVPIIKNKGKVIYGFNMYHPYNFTHQGIYGIPVGRVYRGGAAARSQLLRSIDYAVRFKKRNKIQIYVAEFTAARWAPQDSAAKYIADCINIFESQGFEWSYHAFGGIDTSPQFAYPWSVFHSEDPYDGNRTSAQTTREKVLRTAFRRNRFRP